MPLTGTAEQSLNAACPNSIDTIVAQHNADRHDDRDVDTVARCERRYGENAVGGQRKFKDRADNAGS
jgi:hypothetical protein